MPPIIKRVKTEIDKQTIKISRQKVPLRKKGSATLDTMFEDSDNNPVEFRNTGDLQGDIDRTVSEELRKVIEHRKSRDEQFRVANDSRYFFCVVFQTTQQKEEFLEKSGLDVYGTDFISGLDVASHLGINVQYIELPVSKSRGNPARYKGLTLADRKQNK